MTLLDPPTTPTTDDPIVLTVVGVPAPQGSKSGIVRGGRVVIVEGKSATGRAGHKAWRDAVAAEARVYVATHRLSPLSEPVRVEIVFRFPLPASDRYRTLHQTKPDLDKLARSVLDSLRDGGLLADDSRVCSLWAEKRYAAEGESVGATVEVERLGWYEAVRRGEKKAAAAARRKGTAA